MIDNQSKGRMSIRIIRKSATGTGDRLFERFFFADIPLLHIKIKRQKPRREERPRMSEKTLSPVQSEKMWIIRVRAKWKCPVFIP